MLEEDLQADNNLQKVKIGQLSSLEKEKSAQKLSENIEGGFKVHRMPTSFKSGQFNSSIHPNDLDKDKMKVPSQSGGHKKVGLIIVSVGVLVLAVAGYFVYTYVIFPDSNNKNNQNIAKEENQTTPVNQETAVDENQNQTPVNSENETNKLVEFSKNIADTCSTGQVIFDAGFEDGEKTVGRWKLTVKSKNNNDCNVEVELLDMPEADNKTMVCSFEMKDESDGGELVGEDGEVMTAEEEYELYADMLPTIMMFMIADREDSSCQGELADFFLESMRKSNVSLWQGDEEEFVGWKKLIDKRIYDVFKDSKNNIYYLQQENGLDYIVNLYKYDGNDISLLDNSSIEGKNELFIDSKDNFYTWDGVAGFSEGEGGLYKHESGWQEIEEFSNEFIISVTENNYGLWVATQDSLHLLNQDNSWVEYSLQDFGVDDNYSNISIVSGFGDYLVSKVGSNYYTYKDDSFEQINIDDPSLLSDNELEDIYIKDNIIWFYASGYFGNGNLIKMNLDDYSYDEYSISIPEENISANDVRVSSVVAGNDQDFWILSHDQTNDFTTDYVIISHYKDNNLTHTKYTPLSGEIHGYADILLFKNDKLYVLFSGSGIVGFYEVDISTTSTPIMIVSDSDGDGLTDLEEAILNTNPNNTDTDGDSYSDLIEFTNLYNPLGGDELATVEDVISAYNLADYSNDVYNYSILYPEVFEIKEMEDKSSVMFMDPTNEGFFQISAEPNVENLDIKSWYEKEFSLEELPSNQYYIDDSRELVFSPDGMYIYLTDKIKQRIFIISYASLGMQAAYPNIFSYCADSFVLE